MEEVEKKIVTAFGGKQDQDGGGLVIKKMKTINGDIQEN